MLKTEKNLDLEQIRKGFEMFDIDQTGKISPTELLEAYDAMNLKDKNPFIYNLISSLSEDHDEVSIDDLISYIDEKLSDTQSSEGLNIIFDSLCEPNEESLTLGNLPLISRESEDKLSEKELRYLIERAQMGGEEINFEEFFQIVKENSDNDINKNGKVDSLVLSSADKGKPQSQQVYRKKASNKISNENNQVIHKKNIKSEITMKNSEDVDDMSERKSKRSQKMNSKTNSNINSGIKSNENNKIPKEIEVEKEEKDIYEKNVLNKRKIEKDKKITKEIENGNIFQSPNKENYEEEEDENGMESVNKSINQSINKYLEKKKEKESESLRHKKIIPDFNEESDGEKKDENGKVKNEGKSKDEEEKKEIPLNKKFPESKVSNKNTNILKNSEKDIKEKEEMQKLISNKNLKTEEIKDAPLKPRIKNTIEKSEKSEKVSSEKELQDKAKERNEIKAKYQLKKKIEQKEQREKEQKLREKEKEKIKQKKESDEEENSEEENNNKTKSTKYKIVKKEDKVITKNYQNKIIKKPIKKEEDEEEEEESEEEEENNKYKNTNTKDKVVKKEE